MMQGEEDPESLNLMMFKMDGDVRTSRSKALYSEVNTEGLSNIQWGL